MCRDNIISHTMATVINICCIFLIASALRAVNADYCKQKDCGVTHTMCIFPYPTPSRQCHTVVSVGLTQQEKSNILKLHNQLRKKVASGREFRGAPGPQPPARNLGPLRWDDELALVAQRWANQCMFAHDQCRELDRFPVGQNLAILSTTGSQDSLTAKEMVMGWYNEVRFFNKNQVDRVTNCRGRKGELLGHYIQLVWANTKFVGCGAIRYFDGRENHMKLVCNYGPTGNCRTDPLYQRL